MNDETVRAHQEISLVDRAFLSIGGVEDVLSFDDTSIILQSCFGSIAVDGAELRIKSLSVETGELVIEGKIGGVLFFEPTEQKKKRFFGRK
ncbi:MAG: sporulation protein YabP [Ruminococcaceae bacterium]|nr:sporulation protein YabP [Oscillospiraceae bacterium]